MNNKTRKTMLVLICTMFMLLSAAAQNGYAKISTENRWTNLPETQIKAYRNLKEVLDRNPSLSLNLPIGIRPQEYGVMYRKLLADKKERNRIGRIYAFTIDSFLYINPSAPRTGKFTNFYQAEIIGNYIHYVVVERIYFNNGENSLTQEVNWLSDKLIDTKTGKVKTLNRKYFRKLAASRPDLVAQFNQEKYKSSKLLGYFKEYVNAKQ